MQTPSVTTGNYEVPPRIRLRQRLARLEVGETARLKPITMPADLISKEAKGFASARGLKFSVSIDAGDVVIKRLAPEPRVNIGETLDAIGVGESKLLDIPPSSHQRYRQAASIRGRSGAVMFSCTREGDSLRITRLPVTDEERQRHPVASTPQRQTKYGLERLAHVAEITVAVLPREELYVRHMASLTKKRTGWPISCQLMPGGMMRIYRTDKAERINPASQEPRKLPAKPTKYGLDRLATQRQIRIEATPAERANLRVAASQKAKIMGWTLRCRLQDDGSMLVYRTDAQAPGMAPTDSTITGSDSAIT